MESEQGVGCTVTIFQESMNRIETRLQSEDRLENTYLGGVFVVMIADFCSLFRPELNNVK